MFGLDGRSIGDATLIAFTLIVVETTWGLESHLPIENVVI